jgi:uncharacterized protein with HEPN domain
MVGADRNSFGGFRREVSEERKVAQWPQTRAALVESLAEIGEIAAGGLDAFFGDNAAGRMARRAAKSALIDLGNAAFFVPDAIESRFDYMPWADMRRTRDKLAHVYSDTDWNTIWTVMTQALPIVTARFLDGVMGEYGDEAEGGGSR